MNPILLIVIFIVSTLVGYKLIKNVPSLLHTSRVLRCSARSQQREPPCIPAIGL